MIHFNCTCGQLMSVRPENAGREGNCPRCRQPFVVPPRSTAAAPGGPSPAAARTPAPPPRPAPYPAGPAALEITAPHTRGGGGAVPLAPPSVLPGAGARPAGSGPRLEVVHGPAAILGRTVPLPSGPAVLGRDPGVELSIPSERVSRRHCRFEPMPGVGVVLEDLGSSNGTLVNQVRIGGRKVLQAGEFIQAGDCLFRFCE